MVKSSNPAPQQSTRNHCQYGRVNIKQVFTNQMVYRLGVKIANKD